MLNAVSLVSAVQEAESRREADLGAIISTRRYILQNKRWEHPAIAHVRMTWRAGFGKKFEIVGFEHAEGMQKRAFEKILEAEVHTSRNVTPETDSSLTPVNYDFALLGMEVVKGRECHVLQLTPKRNSKYLIEGKAWIDAKEHAIVRVEGRTAKSVSFWIGKPHISQEFRKVGRIWVSAANKSISDVKLFGRTELTIEFLDYQLTSRSGQEIAANQTSSNL